MENNFFLLDKMESQQTSNTQNVWWGWGILVGVLIIGGILALFSVPSSPVNVTEAVPIHTTEAATSPETWDWPVPPRPHQFPRVEEGRENYADPPIWTSPPPAFTSPPPIWTSPAPVVTSPPPATEEPGCPSEIPGVYPDALDPAFRKCQSQKLAACYAKCHSIDPLYFFYNP